MPPIASILIPCFNASLYVAQAIESALSQTGAEIEVIVVDDGSTDGSLDVIRSYEGRIRWETGPNRGAPAARNRLLELAHGEWVQYLDADDYLRPGKLACQLAAANRFPDCDVIYSPTACEVLRNGEYVCVDEKIPEPHDPWILLAHWQLPQTGGPLWRKRSIQQVGGWRPEQPCCQEHELYFRMLQAGQRFQHCDCCLAVYRFWDRDDRISSRQRDETPRQRLWILDRIEAHLKEQLTLTPARRDAINDTRFATARSLWDRNRDWALAIARTIEGSDSSYRPKQQPASPALYSLAYRLLGFRGAQAVASWKRALTNYKLDGSR